MRGVPMHGFQEDIYVDQLDLVINHTNKTLVWRLVYFEKFPLIFLVDISNPLCCYRLEYMTKDGWMFFGALFPCFHQLCVERF